MSKTIKTLTFWIVIVFSGLLLWQVVKAGGANAKELEITFSKFRQDVDHGDVVQVVLNGNDLHGRYKDGRSPFHTIVPANYSEMIHDLREKGVNITVKQNSESGWPTYLLNLSPLILFAALWFVMIRLMQRPRAALAARLWRPATEAPPLSNLQQGGESVKQSPRLLLANSAGVITLGHCRSDQGQTIFYPESQIGPIVAWMLAPTPPTEFLGAAR